MNHRVLPTPLSWIALLGLALPGCGKPPVTLVPVTGIVMVGDQPVAFGTISFRPDSEKGNTSFEQPGATIQADGSFDLMTGSRRGAAPGWYRVLVMSDNFQPVDPPPSPVWPDYPEGFLKPPLVHERYLSFKETDVSVEVKPSETEHEYLLNLNP